MKGEMASNTRHNNSELGMNELKQIFNSAVTSMQARMNELEEKEKWWQATQEEMSKHATSAANKITLDIGGQKFATSKTTLLSQKGSFFEGMISTGNWQPDDDGSYFIDRNPELFPVILDYLRTGKVNLNKFSYDIRDDLQTELEFYKVVIPDEVLCFHLIKETKLLDKQQQMKIMEWVGKKKKLTLLYCATRDGFVGNIFHNKCDNKGPTLAVLKSKNGHLFGGYASVSWDSSGANKNAADSFLFTLRNPHNIAPTRYTVSDRQSTHHLCCNSSYGPTFGGGRDLFSVCDQASTSFPSSYLDTTGKGNTTFTGVQNYILADIEVYQVV